MKKALFYLFNNFEKLVANLCLLTLVVLLGSQVFSRYVLQAGISWTEELSRFSFIWFVYISGSLAAQAGTHIRVTVIVDRLPPAWKNACLILADLMWVLFNCAIVVSGVLLLQIMLKHPMYSASLYVSMAYIYAVIPLAHALMTVRIILGYWKKFRRNGASKANQELTTGV